MQLIHVTDAGRYTITPVRVDATVGSTMSADILTATTASVAIPKGAITTPKYLFVSNQDATNFVEIYDVQHLPSEIAIAKIPAGESVFIALPDGCTAPAAQANTANCEIYFAMFEGA